MTDAVATRQRWWVHVGLIATVVVSLVFEFLLAVHVILGLVFVLLVGAHLAQRRHVSSRLARRLVHLDVVTRRAGRLALSDLVLLVLMLAMLTSGFVDLALGHPTRIRYHALTGIALAVYLAVHTVRRRRRLRSSRVH